MADTPGNDRPDGESESWSPRRRSNYVPPRDDAPSDVVDDDALADALAAQVRAYTAPIQVPPAPEPLAPAAPQEPVAPGVAAEQAAPAVPADPIVPAEPAPDPGAGSVPVTPFAPPAPAPDRPSSTLEAIERLEEELRRRAAAQPPAPVPPRASLPTGGTPVFPPTGGTPAAPVEGAQPPGPVFPQPYQPFAPAEPPVSAEPPAPPSQPFAVFAPPTGPATPLPPPTGSTATGPTVTGPTVTGPTVTGPVAAGPATGSGDVAPPPLVEPAGPAPVGLVTGDIPRIDVTKLPPPVGLEPAPLPPYEPPAVPDTAVAHAEPDDAVAPIAPDAITPVGEPVAGVTPTIDVIPEAPRSPADDLAGLFDVSAEDDDVVDEVDRVGAGAMQVGPDGTAEPVAPPSRPVPTVRTPDDEPVLGDAPEPHPAFLVETAGPEPTANDLRAGRAARLFWLWFATTSSAVSVALGAVLFGLGMSLRQAIVATLAGVAISFLPLGLGTLAGKWSGQPTMVVSRATFGLAGNVLPVLLAIVSRVFWGGALLWLFATATGSVLVDAGLDAGLGAAPWTFAGLAGGAVVAALVAVFGYGLLVRVQLVLSIVSGILIAGLVALTWSRADLGTALTVGDGPWILVVTGAVIVFSFVGLAWVHSSADVARYQRTGSRGSTSMLWATFGATLPAFVLIAWGAVLAASDPVLAEELATRPLRALAALLPLWYPAPLLAVAGIGLVSGAVLSIYSGGFAIQALGVRARRWVTTVIAAVLVAGVAVLAVLLIPDARLLLRDVATTLAVPVAAWAGIFAAETMIRSRGFHAPSLLEAGGIYPSVRWVNLVGLVVITAVGFGATSADLPWLSWQGYLFRIMGLAPDDPLAGSDVGVFVALLLGLLLPIVAGIPAIRRQERDHD